MQLQGPGCTSGVYGFSLGSVGVTPESMGAALDMSVQLWGFWIQLWVCLLMPPWVSECSSGSVSAALGCAGGSLWRGARAVLSRIQGLLKED